jgi:hypothetical protein
MQMASSHSLIRVEGISPRMILQNVQESMGLLVGGAIFAAAGCDARKDATEWAEDGSRRVGLVGVDEV